MIKANDLIANENKKLEFAELLNLHGLAASGDVKAIKKTIKDWLA